MVACTDLNPNLLSSLSCRGSLINFGAAGLTHRHPLLAVSGRFLEEQVTWYSLLHCTYIEIKGLTAIISCAAMRRLFMQKFATQNVFAILTSYWVTEHEISQAFKFFMLIARIFHSLSWVNGYEMASNFSVYPYQSWCFTLPKKEYFFSHIQHIYLKLKKTASVH